MHDLGLQAPVAFLQRREELLQSARREVGHRPDSKRRRLAADSPDLGDRELERGHDPARLLSEQVRGRKGLHLAARSREELHPELALELADRLGQRRLGDV